MKKVFLLAAVAFATSVNAQVLQVDAETLGATSTEADVAAGTAIGSNDGIDVTVAFNDQWKAIDCKSGPEKLYNQLYFDGNLVITKGGLTGKNNPKDKDSQGPAIANGEPTSGWAIKLAAKKDGFVYVAAKINPFKSYLVFEEGAAIGYKWAVDMENAQEWISDKGTYCAGELKGEGEDNIVKDPVQWLSRIYTNNPELAEIKDQNGLGIIAFPVTADCEYIYCASGSKASVCGFYFKADDSAKVEIAGDDKDNPKDKKVIYEGGADPAGISSVAAAKAENARMFNLAGQEVGKNFKGIVVVNGKKFMNK